MDDPQIRHGHPDDLTPVDVPKSGKGESTPTKETPYDVNIIIKQYKQGESGHFNICMSIRVMDMDQGIYKVKEERV